MGEIEYIKMYSWNNNEKKNSHSLMEDWPIQPAKAGIQVWSFYTVRILMYKDFLHVSGILS